MDADEVLKTTEGSGRGGGRAGKGPPMGRGGDGQMFGKDLYYFSFLGTPSEPTPWMLQFGGHHLASNITIAGDRGILTPTLTGGSLALLFARREKLFVRSRARAIKRSLCSARSTRISANRRFLISA